MNPVLLLGLFLLFAPLRAYSQELYSWVDKAGKVHFVDDIRKVPENYQRNFKIYQALPKPQGPPSPEGERIPETSTAAVPEEEQHPMISSQPGAQIPSESPSLSPDATSARIQAILKREEEIKEERVRMRALYERFREGQPRAFVYRNRIQELDQEEETLVKELDALLAKNQ